MPIYEFRCENCGRLFEALCLTQKDERDLRCPYCSSKEVRKEYSSFATSCGRVYGSGFSKGGCSSGSGFGFG